jgi:hypothetical protein
MTDDDIALRDQLALAELDPDSEAYKQVRLDQRIAHFKAIAKKSMQRRNSNEENCSQIDESVDRSAMSYPDEDLEEDSDQDSIDLMKTMEDKEIEEASLDEAISPDDMSYEEYVNYSW